MTLLEWLIAPNIDGEHSSDQLPFPYAKLLTGGVQNKDLENSRKVNPQKAPMMHVPVSKVPSRVFQRPSKTLP
jgi:hypothetical protein